MRNRFSRQREAVDSPGNGTRSQRQVKGHQILTHARKTEQAEAGSVGSLSRITRRVDSEVASQCYSMPVFFMVKIFCDHVSYRVPLEVMDNHAG